MAGSVAEERLRAKVEALMRQRWPSARIIHELNVEGWGYRLDLAAVTEDCIVMAEIKSDRDVLKRLPHQVKAMLDVANHCIVAVAQKHISEDRNTWRGHVVRTIKCDGVPHPASEVEQYVETDAGLDALSEFQKHAFRQGLDPRKVFGILWAQERRDAVNAYGAQTTQRWTCTDTLNWAVEHLTGRQIRQAVCRQLRQRSFARADEGLAA